MTLGQETEMRKCKANIEYKIEEREKLVPL